MSRTRAGKRRRRQPPNRRTAQCALWGTALGTLGAVALFFLASTLLYGITAWTGDDALLALPRWLWGPREVSVAGAYLAMVVAFPIGWVAAIVFAARLLLRRPDARNAGSLALAALLVAAYFWAYAVAWFVAH